MVRQNIILAGFMGTGKSTVGKLVAERLGMHFADTDATIESLDGRSIAVIFAEDGEIAFRRIESTVCLRIVRLPERVIAVGGGALLDKYTRSVLESEGLIICLTADIDEIIERVGDDPSRPLFGDRAAIERLMAERAAHYASLPHHVDTMGHTPEQVAEEIVELWKNNT